MFRHLLKSLHFKPTRKSIGSEQLHGDRSRQLRHEQLEDRSMLATLTVNITADTVPTNDGNLSLREAIAYVSGTTPFALDLTRIDSSVNPLGQNDTIQFASNLINGTITITGGTPVVSKHVSVVGPARTLTIAGRVA